MSLDAIVWLIAGIGVGVGASLMLLMLYAGLERWRLGRRLRRARVLRQLPEPREADTPAAPPGSKLALLDRKAEPREKAATSAVDAKKAEVVLEPVVTVEPKQGAAPEPASVAAVVRPEPALRAIVDVASGVIGVTPEVPALPSAPVLPPHPKPHVAAIASPPPAPRSVEELFADAFALDKVSVAPLTSDKDKAS